MDMKDVGVLAAIAAAGSLSGAARRLGMTPMSVSRRLAALERELRVRLIHRTTRSVSLTPEGEAFLPYAQTMLEAEEAARATLSPEASGARGVLKVTAPAVFGRTVIAPLLPQLLAEHPALKVDLNLSDNIVDIVGSGIDVAIRIAPLRDSNLIARQLAVNPRVLCASPQYLRLNGTPVNSSELARHACLLLNGLQHWPFMAGQQVRSIRVEGRLSSSSLEGIRTACLQGLGLAQLTYWDVHEALAAGSLVEVSLDDVQPQALSIWALLPTRRYIPLRVKVFLELLGNRLNRS
ncbi:LysR family transcriptional regulator [Pseudomonas sp. LTJR-52]|uniref:LysR substrate-binding domain-containing protein n=1 Tax=Pseudomonas sp. LTJR-52 TaxID=2479392 RepID=UPI000EFBF9C1|nr:LysR substrate-binding domain-containing protein [Pseudomonas sp. LTJR-52]AYN96414.1 LysR family transcriptional regulator [Pseudomonas sp. LTJR-52]